MRPQVWMTRYKPSIHGSSHTEAELSGVLGSISGSGLHVRRQGCVLGVQFSWGFYLLVRPLSEAYLLDGTAYIFSSLHPSAPPTLVSYFRTQVC